MLELSVRSAGREFQIVQTTGVLGSNGRQTQLASRHTITSGRCVDTRPAITEDMAKSIACAVIGSTLDYANSAILKQLHRLPIEYRIKFKIACITYKIVSTAQPAYLHSVLKQYAPSRRLRSLSVPRVRACFGSRSFVVAAPTTWNSLEVSSS